MDDIAKTLIRIANKISEEEILQKRKSKKMKAIKNIAENIIKLRRKVNKDLQSEDEKTKLTATIIYLMDKTAERVGNEESAENDHVGVTGFKKKHIKVEGKTIYFDYVGKSGVDHEKKMNDEIVSKILKELIDRTKNNEDYIFVTKEGFKIKADKVNRYLDEFDVNAKDIRGYAANRFVIELLKNTEQLKEESDRKKRFIEVVKRVAEKVGHGPTTLRTHYLLSNLEKEYVENNRILNLKELD